jgi:hypothetical protein
MERDFRLYFKKGYKYQVSKTYHIKLNVLPYDTIDLPFVKMGRDGNTFILAGYAWDGASGPTIDTLDSMIGSLVHDVGYQLIRLGLVSPEYKSYFDDLLYVLCHEDGMRGFRARYWKWAVVQFVKSSTKPSSEPDEIVAP